MLANVYNFIRKTVTDMLRLKLEPGSLCIVYLCQHHLTFTSGLGNIENTLSDKQSFSTFKGRTLSHLKQSFFGECIACYDETHKIQVRKCGNVELARPLRFQYVPSKAIIYGSNMVHNDSPRL